MELDTFSLLFLSLLLACIQVVNSATDPSDVQALFLVKDALDPLHIQPGSCVSTWDFSVDPCDNAFGPELFSCGIECEPGDGGMLRVTSLKLDTSGYAGTLSTAIGNLSSLQYVQVSGNMLGGAIPSSIGQLSLLTVLDISGNSFTGALPVMLGSLQRLQSLNVADNQLGGELPSSLIGLASLIECRMQHNFFIGRLPNFSTLKQLELLDLAGNGLSGGVPLQFPPNLISVSFKNNRLTGGLTKEHVTGLSQTLNVLDLSGNSLSGPIDASLFTHPSLQQLNLSNNSFTSITNGENDASVNVGASQLIAVDISDNRIGGMLPGVFARMPRLSSLSLSHNAFNGQIHISYALKAVAGRVGLRPLQRLMLDGNYLTGQLPHLFMKLLPGNIRASFADNCLMSCPSKFFFCQGADQKPSTLCRLFNVNV